MQLHCKCVPNCNNLLQIGTLLQIGMQLYSAHFPAIRRLNVKVNIFGPWKDVALSTPPCLEKR